MKTIRHAITILVILFVLGFGLFLIFEDLSQNAVIDAESTQVISIYNQNYNKTEVNNTINNFESTSGNYSGVAPEFREAAESKGTIESFEDMYVAMKNFPKAMFGVLPFVDPENPYISWIVGLIVGLIVIWLTLGIYKGFRTGDVD